MCVASTYIRHESNKTIYATEPLLLNNTITCTENVI